MEVDYLRAVFPERFRLLGKPLKSFSVGHLLLLRWLDNAYVIPDRKPAPGDLIQGVFICSRTYSQAIRSLHSPFLQLRLRLWGISCGRRWDIIEKMRVFRRYIEDGSQPPDLHESDSETRLPGAPFIQRIVIRLKSHFRMTDGEVMEYSWQLALHDYFASYEMENRVKIVNADEAAIPDEHQRLWEQVATDQMIEALARGDFGKAHNG